MIAKTGQETGPEDEAWQDCVGRLLAAIDTLGLKIARGVMLIPDADNGGIYIVAHGQTLRDIGGRRFAELLIKRYLCNNKCSWIALVACRTFQIVDLRRESEPFAHSLVDALCKGGYHTTVFATSAFMSVTEEGRPVLLTQTGTPYPPTLFHPVAIPCPHS